MPQMLSDLIAQRFGIPTGVGATLPAEGELARILARRSHRRYAERPVPEELLAVLLACAQSASAKSDLQQWSVVVVKDPAKRKVFAELLPDMAHVAKAPVFLVFLGDMRRGQRICARYDRPHDSNTLDTFMNAAVDSALAMQTFILAAEAVGLGTCPISQLRKDMPLVTRTLELPPGVFPVAALCVGYPADAGRLSLRLPPALVVHTDRYDDSRFEAELAGYDARRHAHTPIAKQMYTKTYGVAGRYTWSDNVSRRLANRERRDFGAFIRQHGFELE
ncbi:MAG: nitroreductase family protein [Candidatus Lambdaproteobacteria bacterium]|nr:nitroreductase family protein [Candidatus Lambdaproteobacteria bacterium]